MFARRSVSVLALAFVVFLAGCLHVHLPQSLHPTAASQTTSSLIYGRVFVEPNWTHLGIYYDVALCLKMGEPPQPLQVLSWSLADSIVTEDGFYAYGATILGDASTSEIIIERGFWWHPSVISHELIHALTRSEDHEGPEWGCVMPSAEGLPARRVSDDAR